MELALMAIIALVFVLYTFLLFGTKRNSAKIATALEGILGRVVFLALILITSFILVATK